MGRPGACQGRYSVGMDDAVDVDCPECGESNSVDVEGPGEFVQDCSTCCRPLVVRVRARPGGGLEVTVEVEGK